MRTQPQRPKLLEVENTNRSYREERKSNVMASSHVHIVPSTVMVLPLKKIKKKIGACAFEFD
jgi:hypothetical protein